MNKILSHLAILHTDMTLTDTLLLIFCHLRTVFQVLFKEYLCVSYLYHPHARYTEIPNRRQHGLIDMKLTVAFHNFGKASTNDYTNNQRITTFINGSFVT